MNLTDAKMDKIYHVDKLDMDLNTRRRLEALGMTKETSIVVLGRKRNGSLVFKIRGTRFAIGRKIAEGIKLKEETA